MKATPNHARQTFLVRLHAHPIVQNLCQRFEFTPTATVETGPPVSFQETLVWAIRPHDATLRNLEGRVLPHRLNPESDRVLWDFELEADAMLFALKFGGILSGPRDFATWYGSISPT